MQTTVAAPDALEQLLAAARLLARQRLPGMEVIEVSIATKEGAALHVHAAPAPQPPPHRFAVDADGGSAADISTI